MVVKVYVDMLSQPCRALILFLKNTKIPFEVETVSLRNGDQKKAEFTKVTPLNTVPAIQDGDFGLGETVAIIRYLSTKYADLVPDHWYPKDLKKRARVDEYLAFHHSGTRDGCCGVFVSEVIFPMFNGGKKVPEERVTKDLEKMKTQLDKLERAFLKNNNWLAGNDISIADVLAVSENTVSGRDVTEGRPQLKAFVTRVKKRLSPTFDEVFDAMYGWRDSFKK